MWRSKGTGVAEPGVAEMFNKKGKVRGCSVAYFERSCVRNVRGWKRLRRAHTAEKQKQDTTNVPGGLCGGARALKLQKEALPSKCWANEQSRSLRTHPSEQGYTGLCSRALRDKAKAPD